MAIIDSYRPRPGDFFLAKSDGFRGFVFRMAQVITGEPSEYSHAGIVLDDETYIEIRPGGAAIEPLEKLWDRRALAFSQNDLTDQERATIVAVARRQVGRPYCWSQFGVLAARLIRLNTGRLERRVERSQGMICSQFVDYVYERAGIQLFADGRRPGDVSPGSLAHVGRLYHCRRAPRLEQLLPPPQEA